MNYFAHGRRFIDQPYVLAGTALPDWLNVVDRRIRVRAKTARPFVEDDDPRIAEFARGVLQHHADDDWFHRTRAFAELSLQFAVELRGLLPSDDGLRPSFVGHVLVEILLDAVLIEVEPDTLVAYYAALKTIEPGLVASTVGRMTEKDARLLAHFIPRFLQSRFLCDYTEDAKLLFRLNQVMQRVKLAPLPDSLIDMFPTARQRVRDRMPELLPSQERK